MDGITAAIQSIEDAFSILFGFLPTAWATILISALVVYLIYVVVKIVLDIVGVFF